MIDKAFRRIVANVLFLGAEFLHNFLCDYRSARNVAPDFRDIAGNMNLVEQLIQINSQALRSETKRRVSIEYRS
jgi:hypothetical protein